MNKRNRTIQEKINECLDDKIKNLHPDVRKVLLQFLLDRPEISNNVSKSRQMICSEYNFLEQGSHTIGYWKCRGWSDSESKYRSNANLPTKKTPSPFSVAFWVGKVNPSTGVLYTEIEADYKRNTQRPIRKEYWLERGHSEQESIELASTKKRNNNFIGNKASVDRDTELHKSSSKRCKEYYMLRGFTEEESINMVSDAQNTFSLDICIEKYGIVTGREVWNDRQDRWQATLNAKSDDEKDDINRRKVATTNFRTLWDTELNILGILYLLKVYNDNEVFYKIGITTKTVRKRYQGYAIGGYSYDIIKTIDDTIHKCFLMEQDIIKNNIGDRYIPKEKFEGWTECFINEPII